MEKALISRQPIYEFDLNVVGYQLLSEVDIGDAVRDVESSFSTFSGTGLDHLTGEHIAFLNVSRNAVLAGSCRELSKSRVVLEISEGARCDESLGAGLKEVSDAGYKLAIPDSVIRADRHFAELADIVRLDVSGMNDQEIAAAVDDFSALDAKLLADRLEGYDAFEVCRGFNFDYFQGQFFCKPREGTPDVALNRAATVRLLAKLRDPNLTIHELEDTISCDLTLSYELLRWANSAYIGLNRTVESINHATRMCGIDRVRLWASLLAFQKMEIDPHELGTTAIVRAAMCERLAVGADHERKDTYFTAGLFSVLDALLGREMSDALESLPLSEELLRALIDREGIVGEALACVIAYEERDWERVRFPKLGRTTIRGLYLDSLGWTRHITEGLLY